MDGQKKAGRGIITDRRIVCIGIILACFCFISGIYFQHKYDLTEPVFVEENSVVSVLPYDIEEQDGWYAEVAFYYITGRDDHRIVQNMEFPELSKELGEKQTKDSGNGAVKLEALQENIEANNQYALHVLSGRIDVPMELKIGGWEVLKSAYVTYTDGSSEEVSLGNLILVPGLEMEGVAQTISSSASSLGTQERIMQMKEDATVKVRTVLSPSEEMGRFETTINGIYMEDFTSLELKEGETLKMKSRWTQTGSFSCPAGAVSSVVILELEGSSRQPVCFLSNFQQPSGNSFLNIWKYLKQRGVF